MSGETVRVDCVIAEDENFCRCVASSNGDQTSVSLLELAMVNQLTEALTSLPFYNFLDTVWIAMSDSDLSNLLVYRGKSM